MTNPNEPVIRKRGRRGVAILLTLAIMSLLLILAMGFLFNSSTSKMAAGVNADIIKARMLADTGLERFISMIERDVSAQPGSEFYPAKSFYAPTAGVGWSDRRFVASIGDGDLVGGTSTDLHAPVGSASDSIDFLASTLDANLAGWVKWVEVRTPVPTADGLAMTSWTDSQVIGQYAFLAVDETGKLDPGAVMESATVETASTDSGHDFSEVDLTQAFTAALPTAGNIDEFRTKGTLIGGEVIWDSWEHIVRSGITSLNANPQEAMQAIFPHSYELEAFMGDYSDSAVTRHRFNLRRDLTAAGVSVADMTSPANTFDSDSTGGLHFLSGGSLTLVERQTIAANIIDYTDADNAGTTDSINSPTYLGNEKVPYLNELVFQVAHTDVGNSVATISVWPEFVNIYPDSFAHANGRLWVQVSFTCTETGAAGATVNMSKDYLLSDVFAAQSYDGVSLAGAGVASASHNFGASHANLTNFQITQVRAWFFEYGGAGFTVSKLWDYAGPGVSGTETIPANVVPNSIQRMSYEVNDPRYNLNSGQWQASAWRNVSLGAIATMGSKNTACTEPAAGAGNDDEAAGYMTGTISLSTAHISDKAIDSLWELGCIHRAAPWQTINLTAFSSASLLSGGYNTGDAQILDQVKLSSETTVRGKLNANSKYPLAWRALMGNMTLGGKYNDAGGTAVDATWSAGGDVYDTVVGPAITAQGTIVETQDTDGGWFNRGQIANVAALQDGTLHGGAASAPTTDATKEEAIGKLANQLSTRSNWFSVLVTAQALNPNNNSVVLAEHKVLAIVYRDAFTKESRIEHVTPLED